MAATKITRFLGVMPRVSGELLPDTAAQVARDCKLYSGDLIPTPRPVVFAASGRTGEIRTLYGLRDPANGDPKFLTWPGLVNIATPAEDEDDEQRFYYTGDGKPKVSTYALATSGTPPYPQDFYELGLPLPDVQPTATPQEFTPIDVQSYARDSGGNVTLRFADPHNLKSGAFISVRGFTFRDGAYTRTGSTVTVTITDHGLVSGTTVLIQVTSGNVPSGQYTVTITGANTFTFTTADSGATSGDLRWDIRDFNITAEAAVINPTTITYFSPGAQIAQTDTSEGRVDLAGRVQARAYVYTWFTPWEEESIASEPSDIKFVKEGQIVDVSDLPTEPPPGKNFIRGIRLYRTLASAEAADAEFFQLQTLWFPNPVVRVSRTDDVATVQFANPHNLIDGDRIKLVGVSVAGFDVTDVEVLADVDRLTITFTNPGPDVAETAATGTLYYDISENPSKDAARYWGDGGDFDFVDDFVFRSLTNRLRTNDYDPPPENLQGLTVIQNNILAGFVGNDLYFSEPGQYHAWPTEFVRSLEHRIVALTSVNGELVVLTDAFPYLISGNDPRVLSVLKVDVRFPCLSAASVVNMGFGAVFATHEGLALISTAGAGSQIATASIHAPDTWNESLDPTTVVAALYNGNYFGAHSEGTITFIREPDTQPYFVEGDFPFTAVWYDTLSSRLFYATGTDGDVIQWDDLNQPALDYEWKSKVLITPDFTNLGAARVIADYKDFPPILVWGEADLTWEEADFVWSPDVPVRFTLYVDKEPAFEVDCTDDKVFRLPAGYKSDTFEVGVVGNIRLRAIHMGSTPTELKRV
jgi:hypothetical protein